mgnify:CR=1 FL=1
MQPSYTYVVTVDCEDCEDYRLVLRLILPISNQLRTPHKFLSLYCTASLQYVTMRKATFYTGISLKANMSIFDCHYGIYEYNGFNFRLAEALMYFL